MYLGGILMFLGAPLLLGSICGLVANLALTILLMARILGEEKMLIRDLEGYRDVIFLFCGDRFIPRPVPGPAGCNSGVHPCSHSGGF